MREKVLECKFAPCGIDVSIPVGKELRDRRVPLKQSALDEYRDEHGGHGFVARGDMPAIGGRDEILFAAPSNTGYGDRRKAVLIHDSRRQCDESRLRASFVNDDLQLAGGCPLSILRGQLRDQRE